MPSYMCTICGNKVTYPPGDEALHRERHNECALCYTLIYSRRFAKTSDTAIFGPAGPGIGDYIYKRFLMDRFAVDNPDMTVVDLVDPGTVSSFGDAVVFWADNAGVKNPPPPRANQYILANEVMAYARDGHCPGLWFDKEPVDIPFRRFIALNMRNIDRCTEKNVTAEEAKILILNTWDYIKTGYIEGAVIIGNDQRAECFDLPECIIDLRGKLSLGQLAAVCGDAVVTVGKDSGILHLAAAAGGRVVGWGYRLRQWFPIAPPGRVVVCLGESYWPAIFKGVMSNIREVA